ncbi:MAG: sugar ABC transporter permease [Thermogemmatispora sp.]|uniref:carbohydrate ABC transporter permease n=1 Tax=Thermogemmatispora sp. TaxID=1968838 RepID=UPI00262DCD8B|nr:sugar ABC transporter permease [Thermogemmatispora sp.]MBX5458544.1 sugar ABC transporter permease [Thermogemmatispora sp.]
MIQGQRSLSRSRSLATVGFLSPGLGLLIVFVAVPILLTAWISLHQGSMAIPYSRMRWVGFNNYVTVFEQPIFRTALLNVFLYSLANLVIILPLAILLGLFLYQARVYGRNVLRTVLFLPYMIPTVAVAIVWGYLYEPQYGPLNEILSWLHLPPQGWLGSVHEAMLSLVILNVWQTLGYYVVMVVAGLTEIPQEYYEAASLDGAGWWRRHWYITLPLLRRTLAFVFVILTINTLQVFDPVYVLTQGSPVNSTDVAAYEMYITAFNYGQAGQASAMAMIMLAIVLALSLFQLRLFRSL